ncbi:Copia protein [Gossypium australe]|uniref:Copia protein n=1 Tax=Gossypium australe TaxID=47621 RepID=A0A5B6WZY3_9ROSI|nr:Copia protein [Gossypium australe]
MFEMSNLGDMKYFLGMEIHQSDAEVLKKFKMENCKLVTTPLVSNEKLSKSDNSEKVDASDYRSLIGNLLYLFATRPYIIGAFAWNSKKQYVVAQSLAEAEYVSAAAATNQAIWLRKILANLEQNTNEAIAIWVDNKSAIAITKNPVQHGRTKHINEKFHAIREAESLGEISLKIKLQML